MKKPSDKDIKLWKRVAQTVTPLGQPARKIQTFSDIIRFQDIVHKHQPKVQKNKQQIDATLDLHGMTQDQAYAYLGQKLAQFKLKRFSCVLIITGKGGKYNRKQSGVLRRIVPMWMETPKFRCMVKQIAPAKSHHGGQGAFYVYLK